MFRFFRGGFSGGFGEVFWGFLVGFVGFCGLVFFLKAWNISSCLISSEHEGLNIICLHFGDLHQFL